MPRFDKEALEFFEEGFLRCHTIHNATRLTKRECCVNMTTGVIAQYEFVKKVQTNGHILIHATHTPPT